MSLIFYNTLTRRAEEFKPLGEGRVKMYTCGPTVYNFAHIGNFRAYIFEDLLRRYLKFRGYQVTQVMNLTDVDDKTIRGARAGGISLDAFTKPFKDAFFEDLKALHIEPAEHYPAATAHVPEMIQLIQRLLNAGHAYKSDDGSVYFKVSSFPEYGKLAHLDMSSLRAGARVAHDEYEKDNVSDFALWKAWDAEDGDVAWDSPWGRGRPGWHIECSAMSMKYLGESFDVHTGGVDNIFPHHENEIAQSEGATGRPFVKYWLHCGYLVVDGAKMSKSLGNFYTIRDLLGKGYSGREIRYVLISTHYRQPLNFTFDTLNAARAALERIDEFGRRMQSFASVQPGAGALPPWAESARSKFQAALDDDLNVSEALAALFDLIRDGNKALNEKGMTAEAGRRVLDWMGDMDRVFGFLKAEETSADPEALRLMELRQQARKNKNWAEADRVRDELAARGWVIQDTPKGPVLIRKK